METAKVTSKGQITIPKAVRDDLEIQTGSEVLFTRNSEGDYLLQRRNKSLLEVIASLPKYTGEPMTLEQMDEAITEAVIQRYLSL